MSEATVVRTATRPGLRACGTVRRAAIVAAAVDLLEGGPAELTHRRIALRAGVPLAAITYYFDSLAVLVAEAGRVLVDRWAAHAVAVSSIAARCGLRISPSVAIAMVDGDRPAPGDAEHTGTAGLRLAPQFAGRQCGVMVQSPSARMKT